MKPPDHNPSSEYCHMEKKVGLIIYQMLQIMDENSVYEQSVNDT